MQSKKFDVTYHAQVQVDRLSKEEKEQLTILFADPAFQLRAEAVAPSGNSVSRLGSTKRVVWKLSDSGKPVVLSVVERVQDVDNGLR